MSGASFQELFLLMIIGLVILGPKRLPQVANQIGSWLGQARRMTRMMKRQLEDELNFDMNSLNVKKQLGLDQDPSSAGDDPVTRPRYVHDKARTDASEPGREASAEAQTPAAQETSTEVAEELPDDYSPAHPVDAVGTGVGDDADYVDDDELEPVTTAAAAEVPAPSDAQPVVDKKETA
jgi:sec-independent protein translocase protein TatB